MPEDHPISLNTQLHRAFAESVAWMTVGIVNCVRTPKRLPNGSTHSADETGTGTACRWKNKELILTASHVISDAEASQLRFLLRPSGQIDFGVRSARPDFGQATQLGIEQIIQNDKYDVSAIVLTKNFPPTLQFCELPSRFASVPPAGSGVFMPGFPSDQSFIVASRTSADGTVNQFSAAMGVGCWLVVADGIPRYFPSSYDPDSSFLLQFDPSEEGMSAYGYSGAGVWYRGNSSNPSVWSASPVLAGIEQRWHGESKRMICARSETIRNFLEQEIG